ncbi:MAG: hypothetical protein WB950_15935, partial [Acidobacteriaceae bacterium]
RSQHCIATVADVKDVLSGPISLRRWHDSKTSTSSISIAVSAQANSVSLPKTLNRFNIPYVLYRLRAAPVKNGLFAIRSGDNSLLS